MCTGIRLLLLLIHLIISSFSYLSNFQHWNFCSHFPRELWGLEDWNLVHTWKLGRCIMYARIRLLLLIRPFIFLHFPFQFSTLKFFVTLFSGTVKPRRLKIGIHMDSGQMYHVYQNQAAAAYSSLYFFIFLSVQFSTLKFLVTLFSGTVRPRRLKLGTHLDSGQMYHVYQNQAAALIHPFISSFFFLSSFQHWNFSSHFSGELWGLEDWKLEHAWTVGRCIMYARLRLLLLIHPFIHFSFSPFFNIEIFHHSFLRNCEA